MSRFFKQISLHKGRLIFISLVSYLVLLLHPVLAHLSSQPPIIRHESTITTRLAPLNTVLLNTTNQPENCPVCQHLSANPSLGKNAFSALPGLVIPQQKFLALTGHYPARFIIRSATRGPPDDAC